MENDHKLGLYVSYYLARFDSEGYQKLGFGNQIETHTKIGDLLSVNPHTVKNWRDEFDPMFGHRAGWYQRPMSPSRVKVLQALENLDEPQIRAIVKDILSGKLKNEPEENELLLSIVSDDNEHSNKKFILRAPTGRAAEEFFINHFKLTKSPISGELIDCRDLGCGYDFRIESATRNIYIEVKGMADFSGGILFTDKEWTVAKEKADDYFICIVKNIPDDPKISFIQNPSIKLEPKRNIYTTIQINWSITDKELNKVNA